MHYGNNNMSDSQRSLLYRLWKNDLRQGTDDPDALLNSGYFISDINDKRGIIRLEKLPLDVCEVIYKAYLANDDDTLNKLSVNYGVAVVKEAHNV